MSQDPKAVRQNIDRLRTMVSQSEGASKATDAEIERDMEALRGVLGCKAGKEREAIQALRAEIAEKEAEATRLLGEAEEARNARATPEGDE